MPTIEYVPLKEAQLELSLTGRRGAIIREYLEYLNALEPGQAAKMSPDEGETTAAIRRRLGTAAELLGKTLEVTRHGDTVYFWEQDENAPAPTRRRRRRRRANADADDSSDE